MDLAKASGSLERDGMDIVCCCIHMHAAEIKKICMQIYRNELSSSFFPYFNVSHLNGAFNLTG